MTPVTRRRHTCALHDQSDEPDVSYRPGHGSVHRRDGKVNARIGPPRILTPVTVPYMGAAYPPAMRPYELERELQVRLDAHAAGAELP